MLRGGAPSARSGAAKQPKLQNRLAFTAATSPVASIHGRSRCAAAEVRSPSVSTNMAMEAPREQPLVDQTLNPVLLAVRPSKTMAFTDMATQMREAGVDVISLSVGEPDFDTPAPIVEAGIAALRAGKTRYTPNAGTSELRSAICKKLREENGLDYRPEEVVVSNGGKQAIWQALLSVCSAGDEVIVPAPYWVSYPEMAVLARARPVTITTTPEEGFILSAEKLRASLTPRSRVLILCSPSNPTGAVYSREQLEAIAEVVREHPRLMVLSDEIYEYIVYKPHQHISFGSLPGMHERTLTVNGFSKNYAMTGWRLGYLAAPRHFIKAAAMIQSQSTSCSSAIAQAAGVAALALGPGGGPLIQEMVHAFQERKALISQKLCAIPGVKLAEPQGAFYVLPEMSAFFGPGAEGKDFGPVPDSEAFCVYLLKQAHVSAGLGLHCYEL